jgi:hypothetical protein
MADHENDKKSGLGGGYIFLIIIIVLLILAAGAFFLYLRLTKNKRQSAREAGGFSPSSSNPVIAFFQNTLQSLKNKRSKTGAGYEGAGYAGVTAPRGGTGRAAHGGPLDPDEAWDSHVGNESEIYGPGGYYEETELGLHPQSTAYTGAAYGGPAGRLSTDGAGFKPAPGLSAGGGERGRSRSPGRGGDNPFGDHAAEESSFRSISPRPFEHSQGIKKASSRTNSPTGRRSMFREDMS